MTCQFNHWVLTQLTASGPVQLSRQLPAAPLCSWTLTLLLPCPLRARSDRFGAEPGVKWPAGSLLTWSEHPTIAVFHKINSWLVYMESVIH